MWMSALELANLPSLPQAETIRRLAERLWADARVRAIWLGGSLASGAGDVYSDIDLRIAVAPDDLAAWEAPDFGARLSAPVLASHFLRFGADSFLHHLILGNGDILDFLVQSSETKPMAEPIRVLGCREAGFAERLAACAHAPEEAPSPVRAEEVRELLHAFWVNSHKHRKVLYRDLDLMIPASAHFTWSLQMRLWHIQATGTDTTSRHFSGIHGLTELVRAVTRVEGERALALTGAPIRTRAEIVAAIEGQRVVVARLGRALAARYGFEYPAALEAMVLREWEAFNAAAAR
jgi:predicted nucleotidyltransferase